jgi:hypothetical protein
VRHIHSARVALMVDTCPAERALGEPHEREDAVTITATLSAPPDLTGRPHSVFAMASGLTGLAATKALKLAQLNMTDALVFVTSMAAHNTSHVVRHASHWTPVFPAVVTVSVLVAFVVAAAVDIVKLVVAQSDSGKTIRSDGAVGFVLLRLAVRRSQPIAKGLV